MHTLETVKKSQDSYTSALCEAIGKLGGLSLAGSGYSHYFGDTFQSHSGREALAHAAEIRFKQEPLFDYGKPKIIEKSYWTWKSSFVELEFWAKFTFQNFHLERGGVNVGTGERVPDRIGHQDHTLRIRVYSCGFGLGKWEENCKAIAELLELAPQVKDEGLKRLAEADAEAKRWRTEIRKIAAILEEAT